MPEPKPFRGTAIFGFGSILYKHDFEFTEKVDGYVLDYERVFYQVRIQLSFVVFSSTKL